MAPKRRYSNAHVSCGVQSISQLAHSTFFFWRSSQCPVDVCSSSFFLWSLLQLKFLSTRFYLPFYYAPLTSTIWIDKILEHLRSSKYQQIFNSCISFLFLCTLAFLPFFQNAFPSTSLNEDVFESLNGMAVRPLQQCLHAIPLVSWVLFQRREQIAKEEAQDGSWNLWIRYHRILWPWGEWF